MFSFSLFFFWKFGSILNIEIVLHIDFFPLI